jgi:hypothetical protein
VSAGTDVAAAIFVAILGTTACRTSAQESVPPRAVSLAGFELVLEPGDRCVLKHRSGGQEGRLEVAIPAPCDFHRNSEGGVRSLSPHGVPVILIESSTPLPALPGSCRTLVRAVSLDTPAAKLSEHTATVATCPPFAWDAKMFSGLFD